MRGLALVVALSPAVAAADAELEVGIAAGGSRTTERTTTTGAAHLAARLTRWVSVEDRSIHCDDTTGWVATSTEPEDRDGIALELDAEDDGATRYDARAWGAYRGWRLTARAAYQQPTSFGDPYARGNRDVLATSLALDVPYLVAFGVGLTRVSLLRIDAAWSPRSRRVEDRWESAGADTTVRARTFAVETRRLAVEALVFAFGTFDDDHDKLGEDDYGIAVRAFDFDFATLAYEVATGVSLVARGGVTHRQPRARYIAIAGGVPMVDGPDAFAPSYWIGVQHGSASIGAGSWARIDPTGDALDTGQRASATLALARGDHELHGEAHVGRLHRALLGPLASPEVLPAGGRSVIGRVALSLTTHVTPALAFALGGWAEHSDRDDPAWAPGRGRRTHAGADLHLVWTPAR